MEWTNKFTLLGSPVWGIERGTAGNEVSEADQRRRLVGLRHLGGVRRCLFGVGGGPTEAAAEAKQESMGVKKRKQFVKKFVSEQWILSCKSLGCPLVYHL